MRRMRWGLIVVVVGGWLLGSGAAASAAVLAPPGHAGANQYFETIPTSSGNAAPPGSVHGSGSTQSGSQSLNGLGQGASTDGTLAGLGQTGQAAAALTAATAPTPASRAARQAAAGGVPPNGGSAASGIGHVLTGSDTGGLGVALPLLLGTVLLVVAGLVGVPVVRAITRPGAK
jgi:hypothetical protein